MTKTTIMVSIFNQTLLLLLFSILRFAASFLEGLPSVLTNCMPPGLQNDHQAHFASSSSSSLLYCVSPPACFKGCILLWPFGCRMLEAFSSAALLLFTNCNASCWRLYWSWLCCFYEHCHSYSCTFIQLYCTSWLFPYCPCLQLYYASCWFPHWSRLFCYHEQCHSMRFRIDIYSPANDVVATEAQMELSAFLNHMALWWHTGTLTAFGGETNYSAGSYRALNGGSVAASQIIAKQEDGLKQHWFLFLFKQMLGRFLLMIFVEVLNLRFLKMGPRWTMKIKVPKSRIVWHICDVDLLHFTRFLALHSEYWSNRYSEYSYLVLQ